MGLELHTQDVASQPFDVIQGFGNLDATALASATRMDLGFHDPNWTAQLLGSGDSLVHRKRRETSWDRHAKSAQDLFALIFMNFHGKTRCEVCKSCSADRKSVV